MKTQPYLPPASRTVKGNHRSGWGLAQLHGNQRWSVPLDIPRLFLPAAPKGCDGSPGLSRLHARPMAGQKYHCPQMESSQNGLPQTAFRTDGIAHACLLLPQVVFAHRPLSLAPRPGAPSGNVFQQLVILFSRFRCDLRKIPET